MQSNRVSPDAIMQRILFIKPLPQDAANPEYEQAAERAFGFSLLFSGVRCVLQYALLPFVLPLVGIAADAAVPLLLMITLIAIVSIFFSLRRFWRINYRYKWGYLFISLVALGLLVSFMVFDLQLMF
jgi:ABC-type iron transport system FetAB permease component